MTLQIVFHQMKPSEVLESKIRSRLNALERLGAEIQSCRVTVEQRDRHHQKGSLFHVRISLHVPGKEIIVSRAPEDAAQEDAYAAVRHAFDVARRQLEDYLQVRRGDVKHHDEVRSQE